MQMTLRGVVVNFGLFSGDGHMEEMLFAQTKLGAVSKAIVSIFGLMVMVSVMVGVLIEGQSQSDHSHVVLRDDELDQRFSEQVVKLLRLDSGMEGNFGQSACADRSNSVLLLYCLAKYLLGNVAVANARIFVFSTRV